MTTTKHRIPEVGETRYDRYGPRRVMAYAEGYVMCRRPGKMAHLWDLSDWNELSPDPLCHRCGKPTPFGNVAYDGKPWCGCPNADVSPAESEAGNA